MEFKDITPILQLLTIIAGWVFISRDNDRRERRKELRVTINELIEQVYEVEQRAISHFRITDVQEREVSAGDIRRRLERIGINVSAVVKMHQYPKIDDREALDRVAELRRIITGQQDFDAPYYERSPQDYVFRDIMLESTRLVQALDAWFYAKHK